MVVYAVHYRKNWAPTGMDCAVKTILFYKDHIIFSEDFYIKICKLLDLITEHKFLFFSIKDKIIVKNNFK